MARWSVPRFAGENMPTEVRIVHARDFVRAKPEGQIDLEESTRLLVAIAAAGARLDAFDVVLDTRKLQSQLSVTDLWYLAKRFAEQPALARSRIAVLCPLVKFDRSQFFAVCAENRGLRVRAFVSYEEVMDWLHPETA
jgi:hypothetical protein